MSDTTVLRADRWVDVDAGEMRSPAVIVVEGNRIVAVNPAEVPAGATEIDLGDVTLLPGLMDMELNFLIGGPDGPDGPAQPDARRAGRSRLPDVARHGERPHDAAGRVHHRAQPRADGEDRRLHARRGAQARDRPGLGRRSAHHPGRPRRHALRRPPRPDGVPAARARDHAVERRRGHRQRRRRGAHAASATRSATAPR